MIARSRFAHGMMTAFYVGLPLIAFSVLLNELWGVDFLPWGVYLALPILIAFTPLAIGNFHRSWVTMGLSRRIAYIEAGMESLLQTDLNSSGQVGDLPAIEPQTIESVRLIPVAGRVKMFGRLTEDELREFVLGLSERGLSRRRWAGFVFESGKPCTRQIYNEVIDLLEGRVRAIEGRGQGTDGHLIKSPERILSDLGIPHPLESAGGAEIIAN